MGVLTGRNWLRGRSCLSKSFQLFFCPCEGRGGPARRVLLFSLSVCLPASACARVNRSPSLLAIAPFSVPKQPTAPSPTNQPIAHSPLRNVHKPAISFRCISISAELISCPSFFLPLRLLRSWRWLAMPDEPYRDGHYLMKEKNSQTPAMPPDNRCLSSYTA